MKSVSLPEPPGLIAAPGGSGPLYVLCGTTLHAVDLDGSIRWSTTTGPATGLRVAEDGNAWLADGHALVETTPEGTPGRRINLPLNTFLVLPDGFLLAWPTPAPRVERIDTNGTLLWSTPIPMADLAYHGITEMRADTGWRSEPMRPWRPDDFRPEHSEGLLVTGDRLLASYIEHASGLGISFCLDLHTGELAWSTPPRPTGELAVAGPGRFLIGAQGYGAFETYLYDRDGAVVAEWPSHGSPLVSHRGRIRVVELENSSPSRSRLRRLHRDGSMTDGPMLPGYHTVGPVLSGDGRAAFWRDGRLQTADPELRITTLHKDRQDGTGRMLLLDDGVLAFVLTTGLHLVRTDLAPLDSGVWPCGEGNLRRNPALP
jgi:hypothetical protein